VETYVRCLNLSVSVGVALYEAARQLNYEQLQYQPDELPEEAQGLFPAEDIYA
jgi:tRNA (cytidine/uridine-2'-O-)-methyltransferase